MKKRKIVVVTSFSPENLETKINEVSKGKNIIQVSITDAAPTDMANRKYTAAILLESK